MSKSWNYKEPNLGSGSSGSVLFPGSASSGSKTVRFPVPGSVLGLPDICRGGGTSAVAATATTTATATAVAAAAAAAAIVRVGGNRSPKNMLIASRH